jgi:hypothetical protein
MIKSRWMRSLNHVACRGEMRNICRILVAKPEGRDNLEDLGTYSGIMLKCILRRECDGVCGPNKDCWWLHVNMVMNLMVPRKCTD